MPSAFEKSRFAFQAFKDMKHGLLTQAHTVQPASQRFFPLSFCVMNPTVKFFTRDILQAYVQSKTEINRSIYVLPPMELRFSSYMLLRVDLPMDDIPAGYLHCFKPYQGYETQLKMTSAVDDKCLLHTLNSMAIKLSDPCIPRGLHCLQTGDTASAGNDAFRAWESLKARGFDCKPIYVLKDGNTLRFNGSIIGISLNVFKGSQQNQVAKLREIGTKRF